VKIEIAGFRGMRPKVADKFHEADQAVLAQDCRLYSGELRALNSNEFESTLPKTGTIQSVHLFARQFWFHWASDVDVVQSQVPNDTNERTYYTGDGTPKKTQAGMATSSGDGIYPTSSRMLGVPYPETAPSVAGQGDGSGDEEETRFYVYTFVTDWGEESAPSPVSPLLNVQVDESVVLSAMEQAPGGSHGITSKRIYRISTGLEASDFFFVDEIPVANTTYTDTKVGDQLGGVIETEGWVPPPDDLKGLIGLTNGVTAGFAGKDVYFSPNYVPYAYPLEYAVSVEEDVVGLGAFNTNVVILTQGNPYIANGVDPSAVTLQKIEVPQACVSKRSIANFGGEGVAYATPDGLAVIGPGGFSMMSEDFMTQEEWRKYNPSSLIGTSHDGRYIGFYSGGEKGSGGFIFDTVNGFRELGFYSEVAYTDFLTDTMYVVEGGDLYAYDRGATQKSFTWRSKLFETPPVSFPWARVMAGTPGQARDLNMKITADGTVVYDQAVPDPEIFRLPALGYHREWQVELTGTTPVQAVVLASTSAETRS